MIFWSTTTLLLATAGVTGNTEPTPPQSPPPAYGRVVRERIVIRVPGRPGQVRPAPLPLVWREGRGPQCIRAKAIAGARLRGRNSVDLVLKNKRRFRAHLTNSCPALDYYFGFYIVPNPDGLVCVNRDVIRSRMGGQCGIETFRSLKPVQRVAERQ